MPTRLLSVAKRPPRNSLNRFALSAHYGRALIKAGEFRMARDLLEEAAEKGQPAAQSTLCAVYYFAIGVKRNYRKARQWFEASRRGPRMFRQIDDTFHSQQIGAVPHREDLQEKSETS